MNKVIISLLFLFVISCSNKAYMNNQLEQNLKSIYEGNLFGNGAEGFKRENLIINTQKEWNSFLKQLDKTNKVSNEFDNNIDFIKKSVLIAIDRVRNTGGFSIKINEARDKKDKIEVVVNIKGPKATDMVASAIMQPLHIVTINKTDKRIVFVAE